MLIASSHSIGAVIVPGVELDRSTGDMVCMTLLSAASYGMQGRGREGCSSHQSSNL